MPTKKDRKNYWKEVRNQKAKDGICRECDLPRVPGKTLCDKHLEIHRNRRRKEIIKRKANDKCHSCGKERDRNMITCSSCGDKTHNRQQALKQEVMNHYGGFCQCCGENDLVFLCIDVKLKVMVVQVCTNG